MNTNGALFQWTAVERAIPLLLGPGAVATWEAESPFGRLTNYAVDDESATGRLEFLELERGLRVAIFDCIWQQEHTFLVRDDAWIRFNFSLSIDIEMFLNKDQAVSVNAPSWRIINNPPDVTVREVVPGKRRAIWVTVCCKPDFVENICGMRLDDMPELLQDALSAKKHRSFYEYYDFTSRLNSITADILRTPLQGAPRIAYIESMCMELLCHSLDYVLRQDGGDAALRISSSEQEALNKAKEFLLEEYANPPTVLELSKRIGINRNKLYYGFKQLTGKPISEFIQETRLEEGRRLLKQTDLPISEVSRRVGYKHQGNFSTSIKRHFGLTPKQFRQ